MYSGLAGKRVLITGAGTGIGACAAELFGRCGAVVGVHYNVSQHEAEEVCRRIEATGGRAICLKGDLLKPKACEVLVSTFINRCGGVDVLLNNAGAVFGAVHFLDLPAESWCETLSLNAHAPFLLSRGAFAHMKEHGGGRIINISSIAVKYGGSTHSVHYAAAKAAMEAITIGLARAGAPFNILVNAIRPGFIETRFHSKIGRQDVQERINLIPLKRPGQPLDIARVAAFLASDAGRHITGEIISVAGGD